MDPLKPLKMLVILRRLEPSIVRGATRVGGTSNTSSLASTHHDHWHCGHQSLLRFKGETAQRQKDPWICAKGYY